MRKKEEIIALLRSGNFTLVATNNGAYSLYKGKLPLAKMAALDEYAAFEQEDTEGYLPIAITHLVEALNGASASF